MIVLTYLQAGVVKQGKAGWSHSGAMQQAAILPNALSGEGDARLGGTRDAARDDGLTRVTLLAIAAAHGRVGHYCRRA